jgi:hypothetical protein
MQDTLCKKSPHVIFLQNSGLRNPTKPQVLTEFTTELNTVATRSNKLQSNLCLRKTSSKKRKELQ